MTRHTLCACALNMCNQERFVTSDSVTLKKSGVIQLRTDSSSSSPGTPPPLPEYSKAAGIFFAWL